MRASRVFIPAILIFGLGLAGCSSETSVLPPAGGATSIIVERPSEPVRVGVEDFVTIVQAPDVAILDVRTPEEFAQGHIAGAINIPVEYPDYLERISELDPNITYAVYCRSGNRSQPAVAALAQLGITGVYELESGTIGWASAGQPLV